MPQFTVKGKPSQCKKGKANAALAHDFAPPDPTSKDLAQPFSLSPLCFHPSPRLPVPEAVDEATARRNLGLTGGPFASPSVPFLLPPPLLAPWHVLLASPSPKRCLLQPPACTAQIEWGETRFSLRPRDNGIGGGDKQGGGAGGGDSHSGGMSERDDQIHGSLFNC
jgi:hypothetical protein